MSKIGNNQDSKIILTRPRITEKASYLIEAKNPVYTFEVAADANKVEIKKAVLNLYKVKALKVNIVNLPAKNVMRRGKKGTKSALKKALIFLAPGATIDFA
jgi:large subunit ribosomal protein L23